MSRLPAQTREILSPENQQIYDQIAAERKRVPSPIKVLLNSPEAALAVANLGTYVRFHTPFSPALRELVILTVARWFDSQYEWCYHEPPAHAANADPDLIEQIRQGDIPMSGDTDELVAIRFAHELVSRCAITDATFNAAVELFGARGAIDLIVLTGHYVLMAYSIAALDADLEADVKPSLPIPAPIKKAA